VPEAQRAVVPEVQRASKSNGVTLLLAAAEMLDKEKQK